MEKCRVCQTDLDNLNCSYENGICDDCVEDQCDDELDQEEMNE